jgi:predicted MFS family arabinose efflux permease
MSWGALPLGTALGGLLGTYLGLRATVFVGAGGRALAGLIMIASPVRRIRTMEDADALVEPFNESLLRSDLTLATPET